MKQYLICLLLLSGFIISGGKDDINSDSDDYGFEMVCSDHRPIADISLVNLSQPVKHPLDDDFDQLPKDQIPASRMSRDFLLKVTNTDAVEYVKNMAWYLSMPAAREEDKLCQLTGDYSRLIKGSYFRLFLAALHTVQKEHSAQLTVHEKFLSDYFYIRFQTPEPCPIEQIDEITIRTPLICEVISKKVPEILEAFLGHKKSK